MKHSYSYFDVVYKTPPGHVGTHYAVKAQDLRHALEVSLIALSIGSPWAPEEFTLISAGPSVSPPLEANNLE